VQILWFGRPQGKQMPQSESCVPRRDLIRRHDRLTLPSARPAPYSSTLLAPRRDPIPSNTPIRSCRPLLVHAFADPLPTRQTRRTRRTRPNSSMLSSTPLPTRQTRQTRRTRRNPTLPPISTPPLPLAAMKPLRIPGLRSTSSRLLSSNRSAFSWRPCQPFSQSYSPTARRPPFRYAIMCAYASAFPPSAALGQSLPLSAAQDLPK